MNIKQAIRKGLASAGLHVTLTDPQERIDQLEAEVREAAITDRMANEIMQVLIARHYGGWEPPPAELRLHVGLRDSALNWWHRGVLSSQRVIEIFGSVRVFPILDWGCGSGRTAMFLQCFEGWREHWHGCDVDREAIAWLKSKGMRAEVCADMPPLPYHDQQFLGLYAMSVLTHIHPDRHRLWYEELHRVLCPGARAYVTTQGADIVRSLLPQSEAHFALHGWAWKEERGQHYKDSALVTKGFTKKAIEGLFSLEEFKAAGWGPQDCYLLERL